MKRNEDVFVLCGVSTPAAAATRNSSVDTQEKQEGGYIPVLQRQDFYSVGFAKNSRGHKV